MLYVRLLMLKPNAFVVMHSVRGGPSLAYCSLESKRIAMRRKRELEPERTMSMRRECDKLSKARYGALESEFYHKQCFVNTGEVCTSAFHYICKKFHYVKKNANK